MALKVRKKLCPKSKYNRKCPYKMTPKYITIHNTSNDASAAKEVAYMLSNNNQTSYHYAVDDKEAIQAIPLNRNAWHAGDGGSGTGNRKSIGIEICYSKSGGSRFDKAEKNAAYLTAVLLKERGWGIDRVKRHKDWSGKNCPHRTIARGWNRFLNMVQAELNKLNGKSGNTKKAVTLKVPSKTIYRGCTGENVKRLQRILNKYVDADLKVDGSFGPATEKALKKFQRKYGLAADGSCGPKTIAKIKRLI
ncbi:N-acetylmuramoyl-L-alanine amidase [Anaerovorax odorimutans]|uniref:N-acetylmuramoyl-L-alanine amidase n=1 Tax=Anaerovorax odorimutans TaxID=109327 RepID=A0ABT1RR34_9FIRM|nr:N-acetylmuramoyl-L-alanine amidase [Anaerovorax odorimutans]MCQ4637656.1 N-acetylmuramoyl-L-alanine amidase [Anaerovorax odorimutans]